MKKTMLVLLCLGALVSVMAQDYPTDYQNPNYGGTQNQLPVLTQPDNYRPPVVNPGT